MLPDPGWPQVGVSQKVMLHSEVRSDQPCLPGRLPQVTSPGGLWTLATGPLMPRKKLQTMTPSCGRTRCGDRDTVRNRWRGGESRGERQRGGRGRDREQGERQREEGETERRGERQRGRERDTDGEGERRGERGREKERETDGVGRETESQRGRYI